MPGISLAARPVRAALARFGAEVGSHDLVSCVGGRTHWHVGATPDPEAREVRAPSGIVEYEPAELVLRCGAATPVREVEEALATHGQMCPLDPSDTDRATVGGVLSIGWSGPRRLRYGPVRDLLLEARYVAADGQLVKAGAPVVKNVTGYDMCRLLVGSQGTLGFLAEVVLRCRPAPARTAWLVVEDADPFSLRRALHQPGAILWDGIRTWVGLEGAARDVVEEAALLGRLGGREVEGPPDLPRGGRLSIAPAQLRAAGWSQGSGRWVAEIGVGTVHVSQPPPRRPDKSNAHLHRAIKHTFDPTGRLNPGRFVG